MEGPVQDKEVNESKDVDAGDTRRVGVSGPVQDKELTEGLTESKDVDADGTRRVGVSGVQTSTKNKRQPGEDKE